MSSDQVHPSTVGTNTQPMIRNSSTHPEPSTEDPSLPSQRHAGAVGLGPNYPVGVGIGDKIEGLAEEIKGKILRKPEIAEHGRELRTGELLRKERERDNATDPLKQTKEKEGVRKSQLGELKGTTTGVVDASRGGSVNIKDFA